ncbi:response regulator [Sulfitobacter mediterraneus]|uniref:response regulator n=1 Tax=Sulfitobacter mediterraneus TaxID=83219 RepID=UPI0019328BF9|nr:response regulator [Sulfitobacter mediterraneus]MBM1310418.1 response regulator [Sulfitobacter mediterraneus]MBM1314302.1 response regulator [Sulfitobacter mediterraneus]MBM1322662.1 response regulator [Sulfitobacter mediterraneus]MBM1326574.1 response regulator [Sulfitobacter mediterraneus]MBM1397920.1 response regulator [Sulfitobacter mediterraneus]
MPSPSPLRPHGSVTNGQPTAVLILDDERFDRHRLARFCSSLDFPCAVSNASSLNDFRSRIEESSFSLILIDYYLPDGNGMDALELVRLSPRNLNTATIMITGLGQDSIEQQALDWGCADYLTKDELSSATFHRAVNNALQRSELTIAVEAQTYARLEVEKVLEHFAGQCARDIKPMVSRMMRQLRDLRSGADRAGVPQMDQFDRIDSSCMTLWEFLIEMERYQGAALVGELLTPLADGSSGDLAEPDKPPSPFTRMSH